ncbi:MAG: hypothetical protein HGA95_00730 [Caldiserica bacterium]|nr:hypothetical protein [Caldisericota bacterium]
MKKLGIAAAIIFGAIVLIFCLLTLVKCNDKPKNYLSQLHMILAPVKIENPDWAQLRDLIKERCGKLCDFRIFDVREGKYAILEISGAKDPNMVASMLLMKGEPSLLDRDNNKIASGKDITQAGIMVNENSKGLYFGVELSESANERMSKVLEALKPGDKYTINLYVDNVKTMTTEITKNNVSNPIVFTADKNTEAQLLDYLGQAITYRYPYELAVDRNNSFFIPPLSDKPGFIDFQDILGKILVNQK